MDILEFQGEHRWLSNFWYAKVSLDGVLYPSVEHAYQASKTGPENRSAFMSCSAADAKKLGKKVPLRDGWEEEKVSIMRSLVEQKFALGSELGNRLVETGDAKLVEGNRWGDVFWGVCGGKGLNMLGVILMEYRAVLLLRKEHGGSFQDLKHRHRSP